MSHLNCCYGYTRFKSSVTCIFGLAATGKFFWCTPLYFPVFNNRGEMAAETQIQSSADLPDRSPLLFGRTCPCLWVRYIFVTSHALANVANTLHSAGRHRYPPRRFISSPSAAPTALLGSAFLASPSYRQFQLNLALTPSIGPTRSRRNRPRR
jgi:hypothetical protein